MQKPASPKPGRAQRIAGRAASKAGEGGAPLEPKVLPCQPAAAAPQPGIARPAGRAHGDACRAARQAGAPGLLLARLVPAGPGAWVRTSSSARSSARPAGPWQRWQCPAPAKRRRAGRPRGARRLLQSPGPRPGPRPDRPTSAKPGVSGTRRQRNVACWPPQGAGARASGIGHRPFRPRPAGRGAAHRRSRPCLVCAHGQPARRRAARPTGSRAFPHGRPTCETSARAARPASLGATSRWPTAACAAS